MRDLSILFGIALLNIAYAAWQVSLANYGVATFNFGVFLFALSAITSLRND